jgi:hypothetical protein
MGREAAFVFKTTPWQNGDQNEDVFDTTCLFNFEML